ncbi:hypothetical protein DPX16_18558 [Anabarilius grahami]|uniref:Uncharacterized protein n=1 Tax=Anabarilius grahami TaxID=495550 RepID=A0A3N0YA79_ANAGA|nr:hypothetical protein DPX16_18558 [Anabarilius grahami]
MPRGAATEPGKEERCSLRTKKIVIVRVDTSVERLVKRNYLRETTAPFHSTASTFPSIMEEKEKVANHAGRKSWRRRACQETAGVSIREVRVRKVEVPWVLAGPATAGQKVTGTCCCGSRCHPVRMFLPTHPEGPLCPCHSVSNAFLLAGEDLQRC